MNIDKDIKRCKELIKEEHSNWIGLTNQEAIENVLSELEKNKKAVDNLLVKNAELRVELETWKKIAEILAELYASDLWLQGKIEKHEIELITKANIDWARKEVENGKE